MATIEDVKSWVGSNRYENLLRYVVAKLSLKVSDDPLPDVVLQFDAKKLSLAMLDVNMLLDVAADCELVCRYVKEKLAGLEIDTDEREGKNIEDEDDVLEERHAFYINFLNICLIELHFLKFNSEGLEEYLKAIRIPSSRKYSVKIGKIYKQIISEI